MMSRLEALLTTTDDVVVTAELPTIDGGGFDAVRRHLAALAPYVDAVNATDNTAAHAHASNLAIAIALQQLGVEPIMQVVCRDKNRLAIQADIVGAALHGIENICCLTGDDVTAGDEPESRRVFDLDGPQLVRVAATIGRGSYLSGRTIEPAPHLYIGAVENPAAPPYDYRVPRALKKAEAGARFLQLQICYQPDRLEAFVGEAHATGLTRNTALLPTICLVKSGRALRFMNDHVPGIVVPEDTISRVERSHDPMEAAFRLALEQAEHALSLPGVRGIHLAGFRFDDSIGRLVTELGLHRRHEEQHAHGSQLAG